MFNKRLVVYAAILVPTLASAGELIVASNEDVATPAPLASPAPETPLKKVAAAVDPQTPDSAEHRLKSCDAENEADENPTTSALRAEQERLLLENNLVTDRVKRELVDLRAEVLRMKLEREAINERLALEDARRRAEDHKELVETRQQADEIAREADLAKARAERLVHELKIIEATSGIKVSKLQTEIAQLEASAKRSQYADSKPVYLDNPLRKDGTLVISDRRISLNGPITSATANHVTSRISYFNNKDGEKPIFIVIDDSPGGSVMAGYRILKSMEGSRAPVHVVVKSFAASMAATIATLAEESYAYPNAVILHHQISSTIFMARLNLTEQKEFYEESTRWWTRLAEPIAKKMGITTEELIKRMYERSSSGDWAEFADEAVKLKWINHLVNAIEETSLVKNPDLATATPQEKTAAVNGLEEVLDDEGKPAMYLPRLNPKDVYFMYNPDHYYRLR